MHRDKECFKVDIKYRHRLVYIAMIVEDIQFELIANNIYS